MSKLRNTSDMRREGESCEMEGSGRIMMGKKNAELEKEKRTMLMMSISLFQVECTNTGHIVIITIFFSLSLSCYLSQAAMTC